MNGDDINDDDHNNDDDDDDGTIQYFTSPSRRIRQQVHGGNISAQLNNVEIKDCASYHAFHELWKIAETEEERKDIFDMLVQKRVEVAAKHNGKRFVGASTVMVNQYTGKNRESMKRHKAMYERFG